MNGHNVVMGCLPATQIGIASAAAVAAEMSATFPSLRFGLLVGIGGGVPGSKDIRLGDVVVSQPDLRAGHGGVVQYDFGKAIHGGAFQPTGMLNQPPEILPSALGKVQSTPRKESRFDQYYNHEDFDDEPDFAERPNIDHLFHASYPHVPEKSSCMDCDASQVIERKSRKRSGPVVHYGLIASGNQVMKDAAKRDTISRQHHDVLCFEMEAAGLMNRFPCLVVRGICDYCDSHKNKEWQPLAAVAAAAWAKELLFNIAPSQVEAEKRIQETLHNIEKIGNQVQADIQATRHVVTAQLGDHQEQQIDKWLSPPDPSTNYNIATDLRHPNTGRWFLDSDEYIIWKANPSAPLWLNGIPGCGKTILSSAIIEDLKDGADTSGFIVLFHYFDFNDSSKQSFDKMLRSLVAQLYQQHEPCRHHVHQLHSSCKDGNEQPSTQALATILQSMTSDARNVTIVLDALDECETRRDLLHWLASHHLEKIRVLLTSRKEGDIEASFSKWIPAAAVVPIQERTVDEDIRKVVRSRIHHDEDLQRWKKWPEVQKEIETALIEKAGGMFRWAACQLDALKDCVNLRSLRDALSFLPEDLDGTYSRILEKVSEGNSRDMIRVLQFLTFSERPLRLDEAIDAIAIDTEESPAFRAENRMPNPKDIARVCSSLIKIITRQRALEDNESRANRDYIIEL
ncbi:uncharacterized protein RHO25_002407 [Cercospora beticola]|nr:hypothetical protein RHO25_002407 [Cercospora beticola]